MSSKAARTHNHLSNRARNKSGGEKKIIFKGVLDNPFRIPWPIVTTTVHEDVLAAIITQLGPIVNYRTLRKRKRMAGQTDARKKGRYEEEDTGLSKNVMKVHDSSSGSDTHPAPDRPAVLNHLVVGINQVTRRLEEQVQSQRVVMTNPPLKKPSPLRLIVVCRSDINPTILVDHLPHLVAACNSLQSEEPILLVPLQAGAETLLSQAVGLRRAAVLGIESNCPNLDTILDRLTAVPILSATWLTPVTIDKFIPTHTKQIRTSAPKDLKTEKQRRKEEKEEKKKQPSLSKPCDAHGLVHREKQTVKNS